MSDVSSVVTFPHFPYRPVWKKVSEHSPHLSGWGGVDCTLQVALEESREQETLSNLRKGVEGWIHVVREGMCEETVQWETKRLGSRMTASFQASFIRGLFGCEEHCISLLPTLYILAVSPGVNHFVPLSLSLPTYKMGPAVPALPASQSSCESKMR